ncbi:MAG: GDSL-type esterase/lipase family protein [Elusimicrobia bacterium]|nr:GDSL-type esterase/lipase family protein [Candidatus Obscuribacterium magneticum]
MKNRFFLFQALSVFLLAIVFILLDVISGYFIPYDRPPVPRNKDTFVLESPVRGHQLLPSTTFRMDGVMYATNSMGFRDREYPIKKPSGTFRVAVLGDSFIEGMGEKQENTLPNVLERRLSEKWKRKVEVMNCGIRGGSPALYQYWVEDLAPYEVDAYVICSFDNDMDDDASQMVKNGFARATAWHAMPVWLKRSNLITHAVVYVAYLRSKLERKRICREIFGQDRFTREIGRLDKDPHAVGSDAFGYAVEPDKWRPHWERTRAFLDRTFQNIRRQGAQGILVHIPGNRCFPQGPKAVSDRDLFLPGSGFVEDTMAAWVQGFAGEKKIPFVNVYEKVRRWYQDPKNPPLYQGTYYHFNSLGLVKSAEWVEPSLTVR